MIPTLLASAFLFAPGQDPAVPPIGPQSESAVVRFAVDQNTGGHSHEIRGQLDHVWPDGLCPTGELYVTRKGSQSLAIKGFDGFPHLRRDCETGLWIVIPGKVIHSAIGLELERNPKGELVRMSTAFEFRVPNPLIADFGSKGMKTEPSDYVTKDRVQQSSYVGAREDRGQIRLHRSDTQMHGHVFSPDKSLPQADTRDALTGPVELMVGDAERLRGYYKSLREGKRVELRFLEADLRLHAFHLVGLGWQVFNYKDWTKTLFRVDLREGSSSLKNGRFFGWLAFDERGRMQLGQGAISYGLLPVIGYISPRSEAADNGRPWPVFVPPTAFVPAPPEFKPPTDGDGGGGNR